MISLVTIATSRFREKVHGKIATQGMVLCQGQLASTWVCPPGLQWHSVAVVMVVVREKHLFSSELEETLAIFCSPPDTCLPYFGTQSLKMKDKNSSL